jgi:hypothetical protein
MMSELRGRNCFFSCDYGEIEADTRQHQIYVEVALPERTRMREDSSAFWPAAQFESSSTMESLNQNMVI